MATEKYVNNAQTTLNGSIDNSTTTVVVTSAAAFPAAGDFRIIVEAEIMLVTGVSSNTFTVTRGVEGTTGASHSSGVAATHVLTAASLLKIISDLGISGCLGDRKPSTPGTYDEEWEGVADTLPANWSWGTTPSGSDEWKLNSRWPSMLTVEGTGNASYLLTRASFAPGAGDFGIWCKAYNGRKVGADGRNFRIYVRNSGDTEGQAMEFRANAVEQGIIRGLEINSSSETVSYGSTTRVLPYSQGHLYLGMTRTSGNSWTGWYSDDGISWEQLGNSVTHSFTVAKIILQFETNSVQTFMGCDWVRSRADLLFPRP